MGQRTKTLLLIALPVQILFVFWIGGHPNLVEDYYSNGLYPWISKLLGTLLGWIPFSMGDLLYTGLAVWALRYLYKNRNNIPKKPLSFAKDVLVAFSLVYFAFHLLWGLNYYRQPITWKFGISRDYKLEELVEFTEHLAQKTNALQMEIAGDSLSPVNLPYTRSEIYEITGKAYGEMAREYPFFEYDRPSIKSSLYSRALTYMGYSGYLNPFTNEAHVNAKVPRFRIPSISAHEVGHQLGYSAEDATNFIGYLVSSSSSDPYFRYSAYSHALGYCLGDLYNRDRERYELILAGLNLGVRKNYAEVADFWKKYQNPLEPLFKAVFNTFLKVNNQKEGIKSYNSVVGLMINHQKRHLEGGGKL